MHIVRLEAENVKRIKVVRITPEGIVVKVVGPNGSGKTSVLDSMFYAVGGASVIPGEPIRRGEQSASVMLDCGEIIITRKWKAGGPKDGTLTVSTPEGAKFPAPQRELDKMLDGLGFDALKFKGMNARDQYAELRRLVTFDIDVDALDAANRDDFDARRSVNAEAKAAKAQVDSLFSAITATGWVEGAGKPTRIDDSALVDQMQNAAEENGKRADERRRRMSRAQVAENLKGEADEIRDQVVKLLERAARLEQEAADIAAQMEGLTPVAGDVDLVTLRQDIADARSHNTTVETFERFDSYRAIYDNLVERANAYTAAMDARNAERAAAMQRAKMPLEGLGFDAINGEVTLNGFAFSEASDAEKIRTSVAIAMAASPKLKILRIKDGALLDRASWAIIGEMAEAHGYQVWAEIASDDRDKGGIIMEDGEVWEGETATEAEPSA